MSLLWIGSWPWGPHWLRRPLAITHTRRNAAQHKKTSVVYCTMYNGCENVTTKLAAALNQLPVKWNARSSMTSMLCNCCTFLQQGIRSAITISGALSVLHVMARSVRVCWEVNIDLRHWNHLFCFWLDTCSFSVGWKWSCHFTLNTSSVL